MHHDEEDELEEHEDQRCYDGRTDDTLLPAPPPAIGDGRLLVGRERRRTSRACRGLWGGRLKAGCGLKEVGEQCNVFVCVRLRCIRAHVHVCAVRCALRAGDNSSWLSQCAQGWGPRMGGAVWGQHASCTGTFMQCSYIWG